MGIELIIHGTKGGYKILHSSSNRTRSGIKDVRPGRIDENTIGSEAYALTFTPEGTLFTKYLIIRDRIRNMAPGNIAFSLFVPKREKPLKGEVVKRLLDELTTAYSNEYIDNNQSNNVNESWNRFEDIKKKFLEENIEKHSKIEHEDQNKLQSGSKPAAYIYYNEEKNSVAKYFDDPFQDHYKEYEQIIFVAHTFEGSPKNPLNAIRHSQEGNLTQKIDLDNPKYKFKVTTKEQKLTDKIHEKELKKRASIYFRKKEKLKITWSRNNYCTETFSGNITELENQKIEGIEIDHDARTVCISDRALKAKIEEIKIKVALISDKSKLPILKINATPEGNPNQSKFKDKTLEIDLKNEEEPILKFTGDEIDESWKIDIADNPDFYLVDTTFIPKFTNEMTIEEYKKITIKEITTNELNPTDEIKITIDCGKGYEKVTKTIEPGVKIPIEFKLKKQQQNIHVQENRDNSNSQKQGNTHYQGQGEQKHDNDYSPKRKSKSDLLLNALIYFLGMIIVAGIVLVVVLFIKGLFFKPETNPSNMNIENIRAYVQGNELRVDSLEHYKEMVEKLDKSKKSSIPFLSKKDDSENKNIEKAIEDALKKRELIADFNVEKLKTIKYSSEQEEFKNILDSIPTDNDAIEEIKKCLHENDIDIENKNVIDTVPLYQITEKLKECIASSSSTPKIEEPTENKERTKDKSNDKGQSAQNAKPNNQKNDNKNIPQNAEKDEAESIDNKIKNYLKSSDITIQQLDKSKKETDDKKLKKSIELCEKFWELDGKGKNTYHSYKKKVKEDSYLNLNGTLTGFLELMKNPDKVKDPNNLKYPMDISSYRSMTLKKLITKLENENKNKKE